MLRQNLAQTRQRVKYNSRAIPGFFPVETQELHLGSLQRQREFSGQQRRGEFADER